MRLSTITALTLFMVALFITLPTKARAMNLIASEPATIYYTTSGAAPVSTTLSTDAEMMSAPVSAASSMSASAFDAYYTLTSTTTSWEGTDADRLKLPTADYASTYGDESSVTYTLPSSFGSFNFYGQSFNQITADTNGNIWFGSTGSAHSFNLGSNGRSPVIAAWNNDLSSYLSGGVFVQHKTSPERIIIEWQTETYTDEGRRRPHNFEVVLFPDGSIRFDYASFTTSATNLDFGSGLSLNDGSIYLNITSNIGNVYSLGNNSYLVSKNGTPSTKTLDVNFPTGSYGSVTSNVGASWTASSPKTFPASANITLTATPQLGYKLTNWSGACIGTGTCSFNLSADTVVNANFAYDSAQNAVVTFPDGTSTGYPSLQAAYNAALADSILKLRAATFTETISFNQAKSLTIRGGYNGDYSVNNAGQSIVAGAVTIVSGTIIVDSLSIR